MKIDHELIILSFLIYTTGVMSCTFQVFASSGKNGVSNYSGLPAVLIGSIFIIVSIFGLIDFFRKEVSKILDGNIRTKYIIGLLLLYIVIAILMVSFRFRMYLLGVAGIFLMLLSLAYDLYYLYKIEKSLLGENGNAGSD